MFTAELDLCDFEGMEDILGAIADALDFPDWFGMNLDALYDCLTDITDETRIIIKSSDEPAFAAFMSVMRDAAAENEYLILEEN